MKISPTFLVALFLSGLQAQEPQADLLILNGKVYTADGSGKFQEAVAIRGNTILRTGTSADLSKLRGPKTQVIDAHGGAVLPGFNDIHTHLLSGGLALDNVRLQGVRSLDQIQERIRAFGKEHPDRKWIQGGGWSYEPFPGNLPTRAQLDAAITDRPAVMRCYDGHSVWVNSKALALAGITKDTPDPPNGFIVRDPATGEPTGLIKESPAVNLINRVIPPPSHEDNRRAVRAAVAEAQKNGVTSTTNAAGTPEEFEILDEARRAGQLKLRVYHSLLVNPGFSAKDADAFDRLWREHPDNPILKTGIIKMFMDGVIETNTAFLLANYANIQSPGKPNYSADEFARIIHMMDRRGWQIMVHALGDGAVRMTLNGFESLSSNPMPARGRRDRVEHIETIDPADIPRFGKLGVIASMHPIGGFFPANRPAPTGPQGAWALNLGPERAARGGMWKSIADSGGRVVFGSDWFVASMDAMGRIYNITHRAVRPGGGTDQRLTLTAAIDDYTRESAYATFDEKIKGTLAPGMLADIAIIATNVFTHAAERREDLEVTTTIFDGKVVYTAPKAN
jgi:predicted amidohydrolase YtcJ